MSETIEKFGMGWLPDYPDFRDYTEEHEDVSNILTPTGLIKAAKSLPAAVDLRQWCSPIEDQGSIGSCTAHAGVGIVEYFERRAFGRYLDASRLFLYKVTRNLMQRTGDTGSFLRTTMHALVLFGVPPEDYYPYDVEEYDREPPPFCYAFGQNYQALDYYRLDPPGLSPEEPLSRIQTNHRAAPPSMVGG